jgi:hypothetical protein
MKRNRFNRWSNRKNAGSRANKRHRFVPTRLRELHGETQHRARLAMNMYGLPVVLVLTPRKGRRR